MQEMIGGTGDAKRVLDWQPGLASFRRKIPSPRSPLDQLLRSQEQSGSAAWDTDPLSRSLYIPENRCEGRPPPGQ
jgi:hypothetical protein